MDPNGIVVPRSPSTASILRVAGGAMSTTRAVVVDPEAAGRLVIRPVAEPVPDRAEAVVRVRALSLNRGELRRAGMAAAGWRPGWDLAGTVERMAADGSGPRVGVRVVGFLPEGAWAERVAVPTHALAELPDKVAALRQVGAHDVVVGDEIPASPKYDLVIESVGGRTLGTALAALERGGVCVT